MYVERSFPGGERPSAEDVSRYGKSVVKELCSWGFIRRVEVMDIHWVNMAYTWSWPRSKWRQTALKLLESNGIYQIGRYGRWIYQGIADFIREGLYMGTNCRH